MYSIMQPKLVTIKFKRRPMEQYICSSHRIYEKTLYLQGINGETMMFPMYNIISIDVRPMPVPITPPQASIMRYVPTLAQPVNVKPVQCEGYQYIGYQRPKSAPVYINLEIV